MGRKLFEDKTPHEPFLNTTLSQYVKTYHPGSTSGRNLENLFYITRKHQKYDSSGVLENYLVGPDGLEPPTKGL